MGLVLTGVVDLLICTAAFPPERSSVADICSEIAGHLARLGKRVCVLAPGTRAVPEDAGAEPGVIVKRSRWLRPGGLNSIRAGLDLRDLARVQNPRSVLVTTQVGARALGSLWRPPQPTWLLVVGSEARANLEERNLLRRWAKMRPYRVADGFIAISEFTKKCLVEAGLPAEEVTVCYLGLNAATWGVPVKPPPPALRRLALTAGSRLILSVCRLDERKGLDVLLQAMPVVVASVPEAVCLIAGSGSDEARLREIARASGVGDRVHFLGYVNDEDKIALLDACDVFVQPSREVGRWVEGFGLTFLEAAARGKPAIGGRHGAVPEVVLDGETGFVVDPKDPVAIASAIVRTLANRSLAARLGESGRRRVFSEFTWTQRAPVFARALKLA